MNLENVTYDAFISYRHCEPDQFVAENIHRNLEAFKLPKSLSASGKTNGRTKIERVFRDQEELPLSSNLADPITVALEHSDYLIVICSPRLPESKWCLKEIETFIQIHGRDHILAVLVEGEPADSFPDVLRYTEKTITDTDGSTHIERVEVEPLAADVRGGNKKEMLKKIKSELLRLVAPMFGCNYDDLKMRHKEARQKKILRVSLAISAACLVFAAVSTTMALTIHKQSGTIKEQYTKALETQAISLAASSQLLLAEEDRMAAMFVARTALPDSISQQEDKPYTPAAEYALSDSLGIYNNGRANFPIKTLEQTSPISHMLISPERDTITTIDIQNQITIFDVETTNIIASYTTPAEYSKNIDESSIRYLNNSQLVYIAYGGYCIYDISSKTETFFPTEESASYIKCSGDGTQIALSSYASLQIYDTDGNQLFSYSWPDGCGGAEAISFHPYKKLLAFSAYDSRESRDLTGMIGLLDTEKMEILYTDEVECGYIKQASFLDDAVLFGGKSIYHLSDNALDLSTTTFLYSYSLDEKKQNWMYENEGDSLQFFTGSLEWDKHIIVYASTYGVEFINTDDGTPLSAFHLENVINMMPLSSAGYIYAFTTTGEKIMISYDSLLGYMLMEEYDTNNGYFADYEFGNEFDASYRKNATAITIYNKMISDRTEISASLEDSISDSIYSEQQRTMVIQDLSGAIYIYHADEKKLDKVTEIVDNAATMFFIGDDDEQFVVLSNDALTFYDTTTGEQLSELPLSEALSDTHPDVLLSKTNFIDICDNEDRIAFIKDNSIYFYSFTDSTMTSVPLDDSASTAVSTIGLNEDFTQYALVSIKDNTLTLYDTASNKQLQQCQINASLVKNVLISKEADCVFVTYLDCSVTVYRLTDLSVIRTYTNFISQVNKLERITISPDETDSPAPVYALYGSMDCYLLNNDLEPVTHLYKYQGFDETAQKFFLGCKADLLEVPYYSYDMLIEEADEQLAGYSLSEYRKNQLGIDELK